MNNKYLLKKIKIKKYKNPNITKKWISWLNDKEITKYSDQKHRLHTPKTQKKYLESLKKNNTVFFKIYLDEKEIGNIILTKIDDYNKNCEIGYMIGEKTLWGKGVATFVIGLALKYAFKTLKMKKIFTWCFSNNTGSKKALLKNNFKIEGVIKKFYKYNSTKRVDRIYLGLYR